MQAFLGVGRRRGTLKVRSISTDLFECFRIFLVFVFIPNEGVSVFQNSTTVLVGMLIMPYDFQLFSLFFLGCAMRHAGP